MVLMVTSSRVIWLLNDRGQQLWKRRGGEAKARQVRKVLHPKGSNQRLKQRWSIQIYPD
jgi:hypothetical protein